CVFAMVRFRILRGRFRILDARFAKNDVGVGSPIAERVHARIGRPLSVWKLLNLPRQFESPIVEWDGRVGRLNQYLRRNLTMLQTKSCLDNAGNTCGSLEMPDVRFDRADEARILFLSPLSDRASEHGSLDGISHRRTGPVCFDILDAVKGYPGA